MISLDIVEAVAEFVQSSLEHLHRGVLVVKITVFKEKVTRCGGAGITASVSAPAVLVLGPHVHCTLSSL